MTSVTDDRKFPRVAPFEGTSECEFRGIKSCAAAVAAVLVAAAVVGVLLLGSPGGTYQVKARFQNAAQLVKGNLVQTGGAPIGTVEDIDLTDRGEAEVSLAETIRIFPTFLDESKLTVERLETFSRDTRPLIRDLRPVARDLQPTLRDVRVLGARLAPLLPRPRPAHHRRQAGAARSERDLPRAAPDAGRADPVPQPDQPDPAVPRAVAVPGLGLLHQRGRGTGRHDGVADRRPRPLPAPVRAHRHRERGHLQRTDQDQPRQRLPGPQAWFGPKGGIFKIFGNHDCKPSGGEREPAGSDPGCYVAGKFEFGGRPQGQFPQVEATDYGTGK